MTAATIGLELLGVSKRFGDNLIVQAIDLAVHAGEFIVLVGASGCGKSTTLRMIAGLEEVSAGSIRIDGRDVTQARPDERNIAMVFQSYALYPHMTVAENMSFALSLTKTPKAEIDRRVLDAARILSIEPLLERKPKALSGGQRQRVAMGRAIVREPSVFLFDEPLSNLDAKLRAQMRVELALLHKRLGKTTVYVTHDQIEAMTLADRIVILDRGVIQQVGSPEDVFNLPRNIFVAGFIGSPGMNLLPAIADGAHGATLVANKTHIILPNGINAVAGAALTVGIRPQGLRLAEAGGDTIALNVAVTEYLGTETVLTGTVGNASVTAVVTGNHSHSAGQMVHLVVAPEHVHVFDATTQLNLKAL